MPVEHSPHPTRRTMDETVRTTGTASTDTASIPRTLPSARNSWNRLRGFFKGYCSEAENTLDQEKLELKKPVWYKALNSNLTKLTDNFEKLTASYHNYQELEPAEDKQEEANSAFTKFHDDYVKCTPHDKWIFRHEIAMMGDIYFLKVDTLWSSEQVLLKS